MRKHILRYIPTFNMKKWLSQILSPIFDEDDEISKNKNEKNIVI